MVSEGQVENDKNLGVSFFSTVLDILIAIKSSHQYEHAGDQRYQRSATAGLEIFDFQCLLLPQLKILQCIKYYKGLSGGTKNIYQARALRALGLLLADGTPTVGGGKTF